MKKLLLAVLIACTVDAGAQTSFGVKGGVNLSYVRYLFAYNDVVLANPNDPAFNQNDRTKASVNAAIRTSAGFFLQKDLSKKIRLRWELLYQGEGAKKITLNGSFNHSENVRLDYIMIPMSFVWQVHPRIAVLGGEYVSYLVQGNGYQNEKFGDRIDYGVHAGAEFNATKKISIGLAYYYGISNILPSNSESVERIRNGQLYLRYTIRSK